MASPREDLIKHAERYKETVEWLAKVATAANSRDLTLKERKQLPNACQDAIAARNAYRGIISSINENDDLIGDFPTDVDPRLSDLTWVFWKLKTLCVCRKEHLSSSLVKANGRLRKAGYYSRLAEVKTGQERDQAVQKALSEFEAAAEAYAKRYLAANFCTRPELIVRLKMAVKFSDFYYNILKSPDGACRIAKQAVDIAMPVLVAQYEPMRKMAAEGGKLWEGTAVLTRTLLRNITLWTTMMQGFGSGFGNLSYSSSLPLSVTIASLREELVKQAERYKEMVALIEKIAAAADSGLLTNEERIQLKSAYMNAMNVRIASMHTVSLITSKQEEEEEKDDPAEIIDPNCSDITTVLLKVLDSREIPYAASGLAKVECLRRKARYCKELAEVKTGAEREEAVKNVLSIFKAAQDIAHADLAPSHPERLGLAVEFSVFYYDILKSPDDACDVAKQALDEAIMGGSSGLEGELAALAVGELDTAIDEYDKYRVAGKMAELRLNIAMWKFIHKRKLTMQWEKREEEDESIKEAAAAMAAYIEATPMYWGHNVVSYVI